MIAPYSFSSKPKISLISYEEAHVARGGADGEMTAPVAPRSKPAAEGCDTVKPCVPAAQSQMYNSVNKKRSGLKPSNNQSAYLKPSPSFSIYFSKY